MAFNNIDVNSDFFTPQEFPVEVLEIAKTRDVVPCCLNYSAKQFVAFMLLKEHFFLHNGIAVFIQDPSPGEDISFSEIAKEQVNKTVLSVKACGPPPCHVPLETLSSIPTIRLKDVDDVKDVKYEAYLKKENEALDKLPVPCTIFCSRRKYLELSKETKSPRFIPLDKLSLVICDNVHEALRDETAKTQLSDIFSLVRSCNKRRSQEGGCAPIRMTFLTVSLLHFYGNESDGFWRMRETFKKLERLCGAKVDTTSDVVALLRYSPPITERIVPLNPTFLEETPVKLSCELLKTISSLKHFLETHVFDPVAAFGYDPNAPKAIEESDAVEGQGDTDSIAEELKKINHPNREPLKIIQQFELVLEKFGPWCADRSLILLLQLVDRLKVRTPYERHYLLLGALQTRLILLQAAFYKAFKDLDPLQVLEIYATPKLRSILHILRRFDLTTPIESMIPKRAVVVDEDDDDEKNDLENGTEVFENKIAPPKPCRERRRKNARWNASKRGRQNRAGRKTSETEVLLEEKESDQVVPIKVENEPLPQEPLLIASKAADEHEAASTSTLENGHSEIMEAEDIQLQENDEKEKSTADVEKPKQRRPKFVPRRGRHAYRPHDPQLCGIIFVENRFDARILFHYLKEAARLDPKLVGLGPTLAICANSEYGKDSREAEMEHKKREDNLRKFRYREANLLIGTSVVEDGIELPKANLVIRFDAPKSFRSYLFSKGRAQGHDAEFFIFAEEETLPFCLRQLATYRLVQEILLAHSVIPRNNSLDHALEKKFEKIFPSFKTATLSASITIINRYCARLPSDTFTRLVPLWKLQEVNSANESRFTCTLRLPINSPVKWPITGVPMTSSILAKQAVALQTVIVLHTNGELDDNLMPIGKEGVVPEPDLCVVEELQEEEYGEFRPGSTKRRQYYDKKLASQLILCNPKCGQPMYLYWIQMILTCPLPEEQNTRGRKLHPPELCLQSFGILLAKELDLVPAFPIYTRCGEVQVQMVRVPYINTAIFTTENLEKLSTFHHYTFTSVLRLDKYLTLFDPELSENSYYVVPVKAIDFDRHPEGIVNLSSRTVDIDWDFLDTIWATRHNTKPIAQTDEERKDYVFRKEDYDDAVVMPWYRSHDAPQYFYVAEICSNLTPKSQFPGCEFKTFHEYYQKKYNINIQCVEQPLLDVDHTSARLNFLTPRYVNRKGMALPTSSESTKKAKRENLEQKQILVPELCSIHPFTASRWRQAVSLPCILYRLNCLLLSNNLRQTVASEICGLGLISFPKGYKWDPLSFGWSLSDVVAMTQPPKPLEPIEDNKPEEVKSSGEDPEQEFKAHKENVKKKKEGKDKKKEPAETSADKPEAEEELSGWAKAAKEPVSAGVSLAEALLMNEKHLGKSANEILSEEMKKCKQPTLEIGMWSNEMAADVEPAEVEVEEEEEDELLLDPTVGFPSNLMMLDKNWTWGGRSRLFNHRVHRALYGSPTHWGEVWDRDAFIPIEDLDDPSGQHGIDNDTASVASDMSGSDASFLDEENSLKIQFHSGNTAEALDKRKFGLEQRQEDLWTANEDLWWQMDGLEEFDGISGKLKSDEELARSIAAREEALRTEFENEVNDRINGITDIVPWESLTSLPSRIPAESQQSNAQFESVDPVYETLVQETTPLKPPKSFPANESFYKDVSPRQIQKADMFSFDYQPNLRNHTGPSPCQILQALTMSNANDGLNLERLETIGDSFLKYAITSYLFCTYEYIHEGKLSHLRSKQVSNVHLYRLGRRRGLGKIMVAAKFEPHDNWLPPGYHIPKDLDKALILSKLPPSHVSMAQVTALKGMSPSEMETALKNHSVKSESEFIPYNLVTQQSIPDKSIADCVEALIGAYLTSMGPQGALLFMSWLGIRVLPSKVINVENLESYLLEHGTEKSRPFHMKLPASNDVVIFDTLCPPKSPLLRYSEDCEENLETLLKGYDQFEDSIGYRFRDRSYLLQAFTHASYSSNSLTDCYQRLEFLGDAILDYLITRHLYEDPRQHSPGSLTDLRSALVNNTIFASLAVKNNFHKFFRHSSPGLGGVLQKFVTFQEQHGNTLTQDYYLMDEEECEEAEDIEVPKALGDVFESVAGAIFLDSNMSLDAVWRVYFGIMRNEIEAFSKNVPKSPIRELLELEPETAKFGKPEKLWDGRRVRVTVEIFGVGVFRGIGRNYRIAKCTAAKCALRHVRKIRLNQARRHKTE